jgi:hypothetical protein
MEIVPNKIRMEGETVLTQVAYLILLRLFFRELIFTYIDYLVHHDTVDPFTHQSHRQFSRKNSNNDQLH